MSSSCSSFQRSQIRIYKLPADQRAVIVYKCHLTDVALVVILVNSFRRRCTRHWKVLVFNLSASNIVGSDLNTDCLPTDRPFSVESLDIAVRTRLTGPTNPSRVRSLSTIVAARLSRQGSLWL